MSIDDLEQKAKNLRALADRIDDLVVRMRPMADELDQLVAQLPVDVDECPTTQMEWVLYILKHGGPASATDICEQLVKGTGKPISSNNVRVLLSRLKGQHKIARNKQKLWRIAAS